MNTATEPAQKLAEPLTAELVRGGVDIIEPLAVEWGRLCDAGPCDEPFYRPEWIRAYARAFAPRREFLISTVRRAGVLVAVLPLLRELGTVGGLPARKLRSASNTHSCRFELVHAAALEHDAIPVLWDALRREPGWDVLELTDVPVDGALARLGRHAHGNGFAAHVAPSLSPPYLDLAAAGGDFDRLLARVDGKFRANLRRRMRKLEARGAVSIAERRSGEDAVRTFLALEQGGWKGAEASAIASRPETEAFYREVARMAELAGMLSMYALELDGRAVAMFFGLLHRGRYYLLKTTYDESLRDVSPGQILTHHALRELVARNCREFDFLGGMMEWKRDWAPDVRQLVDIHICRGPAGRALHAVRFRLRPAVAKAVRKVRAAS